MKHLRQRPRGTPIHRTGVLFSQPAHRLFCRYADSKSIAVGRLLDAAAEFLATERAQFESFLDDWCRRNSV